MTEAEEIRRARGGDGDAWEALTHAHQEPVFRYAYLLCGDPDEARDITQETFVRAYYSLNRFEAGRPLRPWLLRIAFRFAQNRRRSAGRLMRALERFAREPQPDEDEVETGANALRSAISRLKPDFQEVIYLRYFMGLSEEEAASSMGVPAGTVKSRSHRALQELRALMLRERADLPESLVQ